MKIAEGCDHPCTFCVIPQYRGAFRSRRFESVISEATRLFQQGIREINLIGQDTTCYGEDFGLKDGLADLLARLAQIETPHEKWIRFLYAYPNKVTQSLLDTIAEHPALAKYIDMPLQHASARVLKRMKRGASGDIFLKLIERIRRTIPGVAIRTSFIVGFPGETADDFDELCQFVRGRQIRQPRRLHLLRRRHQRQLRARRQSGRPHDPQSQAPADGDPAQDRARAQSRAGRAAKSRYWSTASRRRPIFCGKRRMATQAPEIDGVTLINDFEGAEPRPGEIRRLRITEAHDYDVVGTLLRATEPAPPPRRAPHSSTFRLCRRMMTVPDL